MRIALSMLFGAVAAYVLQNMVAANGFEEVAQFLTIFFPVSLTCYVLIGVSHG